MKYAIKHKENSTEYRRRQSASLRERNPIRYIFNQARYRAKKRGIEFSIELEDIEVPENCPVFGIPLFFSEGRRTDNSYSLDRWDNAKGYVKGNVKIISWKANQYKGDMTIDEVERLLNYMKGISH